MCILLFLLFPFFLEGGTRVKIQSTTYRIWIFFPIVWVPGIKIRSSEAETPSALATSAFTHLFFSEAFFLLQRKSMTKKKRAD